MIGLAGKHDKVDFDTSAYLPAYYPPRLIHYQRSYGPDEVLFGGTFPLLRL